jgi:hypothetical protein
MSTSARVLAAARRRLRLRYVARSAALGAWVGVVLASAILGLSRFWWPWAWLGVPWVALGVGALPAIVGAIVGAVRPILSERELALLVDRALGTDEALVTLLHLESKGQAPPSVQADLERRVAALPVGGGVRPDVPLHAWLAPVAAVLAALILWIPQLPGAVPPPAGGTPPVQTEAERLQEALEEIEKDSPGEIPDDVKEELDDLVKDMKDGSLDAKQAEERLKALQDQLKEWEEKLQEEGGKDADALQAAADALREEKPAGDMGKETEKLADALENGDMQQAKEAVQELTEQVKNASPEDRQQLGEALRQAGEALQGAESQELKQAGEAISKTGSAVEEQAKQEQNKPGNNGGAPGEQGDGTGNEGGEQASDALEKLKEQLSADGALKDRLQADKDKLARSQELNGALEASRQRLGGEADVNPGEGEGEQPGQGEPAVGMDGQPSADATSGPNAGKGHTWEDAGTHDTQGPHRDADRTASRTPDRVIDDFEAFYEPLRLKGAEGLVAPVQGRIDESGQMDSLPTRRTDGDEQAQVKLLDVPDRYVDAADEALTRERVPPGYRGAVKDYFDSME